VKVYADIVQDLEPMRSLVFTCEEFALTGLYDPRFLQDLLELTLLDQRRNAEPQRYNYTISRQLMGGFVEPGQSSYLLFRYGRVGNRLVLLNLANTARDERDARGFRTRQLDSMSAMALQTARDFWYIDRGRLDEYRKVGVQAGLIDKLSATAKAQIDRAQGLECIRSLYDMPGLKIGHLVPSLDAQTLMREATGAWANEARVYNATRDMANDVIRAAIFLLLLCVPFAFCMERLLVGTPNIYRQIAYMAIIFVIMMLALRAFHPAFKISNSPLIIIIAFAIIFMSIVVISVVYSKFDTELKRIRSGKGTPVTTSFARVSVLMSAVLLGIANMRKRRFRTALTSITIILITFAVLCFTSASSYLDATTLPTGLNKTYTGLQMRQRGFRVMQPLVLDNLRAVLAEPGLLKRTDASSARLVEHWWNVSAADPKDNTHIIARDTPAAAAATTRPSTEPRAYPWR
jgi:hypothetical protein